MNSLSRILFITIRKYSKKFVRIHSSSFFEINIMLQMACAVQDPGGDCTTVLLVKTISSTPVF